MELTDKLKQEIDAMSYEELLRRLRFSPCGDAMFQGESGEYWAARMKEMRSQRGGDARHVAASKKIGWDR